MNLYLKKLNPDKAKPSVRRGQKAAGLLIKRWPSYRRIYPWWVGFFYFSLTLGKRKWQTENPDRLLILKSFRKDGKGMKKFLVVIMLMLSLVVAIGAKALTMEDLIRPGAFIIVDDKKFYDFVFISAAVPPGNIAVEPIDTPFNPGLRFGGGLFAPQGGFNVVDVGIGYKVEVLPGGSAIKDISLLTAGYVLIGNGMVSVGESVFLGNTLIGSLQNEFGQQFDLADFDPTYGPITVLKDILLIAPGPGDFAAFSIVEQRFSETTTPSNQPPVAICHDVTVSAGSTCTASPFFSISNGSYDPDGDPITLAQSPTGPYPVGITPMILTVTDSKGASSECTGKVTVVDTTPPTITFASANPSVLWPPNHKMVSVTLTVTATDNCGGTPACKIISVSSNEPIRCLDFGDRAPDWQVTGNLTVDLRSERSGKRNGRIYTINLICSDAAGNLSSMRSLTVSVPRIQKK